MLPATETPGSARCPHQSMQRAPVCAAVPPPASMTWSWRWSMPRSMPASMATTSDERCPSASRPRARWPSSGFGSAWLIAAPCGPPLPRADRADGEEPRGDGQPEQAAFGVFRQNGPGHGIPSFLVVPIVPGMLRGARGRGRARIRPPGIPGEAARAWAALVKLPVRRSGREPGERDSSFSFMPTPAHETPRLSRTSRTSRRASPRKLIDSTVSMIARPGKTPEPPGPADEAARIGEDEPPGRGVRADAEAQERQHRLRQDRVRNADRRQHDHRRCDVGQDVAPHDPPVGATHGAGGGDVLLLLDREGHASGDPREIVQVGQRDRDDHVQQAGTEDGDEVDRDQDVRERPLQVDVAHDEGVGPAAEVARHDSHGDPQHQRDGDRDQPDEQGHARPVDDPREQVAAEVVDAERMGRARLLQHHVVHGVRIEGREPRREDCRHRQHGQEYRAGQRAAVAQDPPGGARPL